jgi:hypothetical protein
MKTTSQPKRRQQNIRVSLALNVIVPIVVYATLRHYQFSDFTALAWSSVIPTLDTISTWIIDKQADLLGTLSVFSLALQLLANGLLSSHSVLLKADGLFTTAPIGLAFIISALVNKPLLVSLRQTILSGVSGPQAKLLAAREPSQRKMVMLSIFIGSTLVLYAAINLTLAIILPPVTFQSVSGIVGWVAIALCVVIVIFRKKKVIQQSKRASNV